MSSLLERYHQYGYKPSDQSRPPVAIPPVATDTAATALEESGMAAIGSEEAELISHEGDLSEMSRIDDFFGDFKKLATHPMEGSMLSILRKPKIGKKEMGAYFTDVYLKRLAPMIIDPDVELHSYILYSLVVPHAKAVELSETISSAAKLKGGDVWSVLSEATGHPMQNRGDVVSLIRVVLRRYPKVIDFLLPKNTKTV